jgi:hypothetical protein
LAFLGVQRRHDAAEVVAAVSIERNTLAIAGRDQFHALF